MAFFGLMAAVMSFTAAPVRAELAASVPEVQQCVARPELGPGSTGEDVRCLQYLLILLGLPVQYTGVYDAATQNGVRFFQGTHPPLTADGVAGEQTLIQLGIRRPVSATSGSGTGTGTAPGVATSDSGTSAKGTADTVPLQTSGITCLADAEQYVGTRGQSVVCLQQKMTELGLYHGAANGVFDAVLQKAVRGFQQAHPPLQADGRAGPRTLAALGIWSGVSPKNGVATGTINASTTAGALAALPSWNMTADGIPFFGTHQACSRADAITIATEFARDGADIATQYWAVYIASREGGCRYDAVNINPATKDDSHCSFQLNVLSGTFEPHGELGRRGWTPDLVRSSMRNCADAASDLWVFCGQGPWTPPYACAPPWEGSRSTPMDPVTATTIATTTTTTPVQPTDTGAPEPPAAVPDTSEQPNTTTPPGTTTEPPSPTGA